MQLASLQIHNFRGIREFSTPIEFHDYTLLVGPNNSGKSTVIDAICMFYDKGSKFEENRDFPKGETTDKDSWVELEFQLEDDEHDSLPADNKSSAKKLRVRKYLKIDKNGPNSNSIEGGIYAYLPNGNLATKLFYATKSVQLGKFGHVIYIPALSSIDDEVKMTGPSALRDLISNILGDSIKDSPAYSILSKQVDDFATDIRSSQNPNGLSMDQFSQDLDSELQTWNIKTSFTFATPSPADILKSMFRMTVQDTSHGGELNLERFGSGFQRQFIYTLIKMRARYQAPAAKSASKDFKPDMTLLLFEEPEAFLHPQQQDLLARELRKLAKDGTFQVICSTHSPTFVSRNSDQLTSIVRLRRDLGYVNKAQISKTQLQAITVDNIEKYKEIDQKFPQRDKFAQDEEDLDPQMEEIKYFMWLNPDRCSMFFARHVLIVEGYTEYVLINRLIADGYIDNTGVYILECNGKFKMHAYMGILTALEIEHSVIYDDDQNEANEQNTKRQNEINTLIKGVASLYTVKLQAITPDLETMLDIDMTSIIGDKKNKQQHRKPQHVLYWYQQNKIDNQRLMQFCKLVNDCIAVTRL